MRTEASPVLALAWCAFLKRSSGRRVRSPIAGRGSVRRSLARKSTSDRPYPYPLGLCCTKTAERFDPAAARSGPPAKANQAEAAAQCGIRAQSPAPPERRRLYRDDARRDRAMSAEPVVAAAPKGRKRVSVAPPLPFPAAQGKPGKKFFAAPPPRQKPRAIIDLGTMAGKIAGVAGNRPGSPKTVRSPFGVA
jgi:hypothetical protein